MIAAMKAVVVAASPKPPKETDVEKQLKAFVTRIAASSTRNLEAGKFPLWRDLRTPKKAAR
jgi:hypothetical protein